MRKFTFLLFLLFAIPSLAQEVKVVTPNGDTAVYVPQKIRRVTRIEHDSLWMVIHDTVGKTEIFEREIEPVFMSVKVESLHDTIRMPPDMRPAFGIYGEADFHNVLIAPAIKISFGHFDLYLFMGAYYNAQTHLSYFTAGASGFAKF